MAVELACLVGHDSRVGQEVDSRLAIARDHLAGLRVDPLLHDPAPGLLVPP